MLFQIRLNWLQEGQARSLNQRKNRKGAFWEDRYHATVIGSGEHLFKSKIIHPGVGMKIEKALPFPAKIEATS